MKHTHLTQLLFCMCVEAAFGTAQFVWTEYFVANKRSLSELVQSLGSSMCPLSLQLFLMATVGPHTDILLSLSLTRALKTLHSK